MKSIKCLLVILIAVMSVGCLKKHDANINLTEIKEKNKIEVKEVKKEEIDSLLYPYTTEACNKQVYREVDATTIPQEITSVQAEEDITYLFEVLKYGYAGYQFFGGDKAFDRAKQITLDEIKSYKKIDRDNLIRILYKNLYFIQDAHFTIEDMVRYRAKMYFSYNEREIYKDENGYYFLEEGDYCYLTSINDQADFEQYLKPSISKDGQLVYQIGIIDRFEPKFYTGHPLNISIKKDNVEEKRVIRCKGQPEDSNKKSDEAVKLYENKGITILEISSFWIDDITELLNTAEKLRNEPIFIVDLRGNIGGNGFCVDRWMYRFNDYETPYNPKVTVRLNTATTARIITQGKYEPMPYENIGWDYIKDFSKSKKQREQKVYILMDKRTASASEVFIDKIKSICDVTLVGTNSMGATLIVNNWDWYLPNSKIKIKSGIQFNIDTDLENRDGEGIMPDLWVNTEDAMSNLIEYIRLNLDKL